MVGVGSNPDGAKLVLLYSLLYTFSDVLISII